jgi:8-amino-7-oxononanoate synthase
VDTSTPIKPFIIGDSVKALKAASEMKKHGIWITGIRPPTVPIGRSRLRITLTATHSKDQVLTLCRTLNQVMETLS